MLEPLSGCLCLAERLCAGANQADAFNFGPQLEANRSVRELVAAASRLWDQLSPDQRLAYRDQQQPAEVAPTPDKVSANS